MSFVIAVPEQVASAASEVAALGTALDAANSVAAASTTSVLAAAQDEVSAAVAALFSEHGQGYQTLSTQAAAFQEQFMQALNSGAGAYASAEAANTGPLAGLLAAVNAPVLELTGRPLIGNGANGAPASGQNGAPGGLLLGDGGPAVRGRRTWPAGLAGPRGGGGPGAPAAAPPQATVAPVGRAGPVAGCWAMAGPAGPAG